MFFNPGDIFAGYWFVTTCDETLVLPVQIRTLCTAPELFKGWNLARTVLTEMNRKWNRNTFEWLAIFILCAQVWDNAHTIMSEVVVPIWCECNPVRHIRSAPSVINGVLRQFVSRFQKRTHMNGLPCCLCFMLLCCMYRSGGNWLKALERRKSLKASEAFSGRTTWGKQQIMNENITQNTWKTKEIIYWAFSVNNHNRICHLQQQLCFAVNALLTNLVASCFVV